MIKFTINCLCSNYAATPIKNLATDVAPKTNTIPIIIGNIFFFISSFTSGVEII